MRGRKKGIEEGGRMRQIFLIWVRKQSEKQKEVYNWDLNCMLEILFRFLKPFDTALTCFADSSFLRMAEHVIPKRLVLGLKEIIGSYH